MFKITLQKIITSYTFFCLYNSL